MFRKTVLIGIIGIIFLLIPGFNINAKAEERNYIYKEDKVLCYNGNIKDLNLIYKKLEKNIGVEYYFKVSKDINIDNFNRELTLNLTQKLAKYKYQIELYNIEDNKYMIRAAWLEQHEANKNLGSKITKIYNSLKLKGKSDTYKIVEIHDYIVENYKYSFVNYSISESLVTKKIKCDGYASLFHLLGEEAGLKVLTVTGYNGKSLHTYNLVLIEGKYYRVDCTFDASNFKKGKGYRAYVLIKAESWYEFGENYQELNLSKKNLK